MHGRPLIDTKQMADDAQQEQDGDIGKKKECDAAHNYPWVVTLIGAMVISSRDPGKNLIFQDLSSSNRAAVGTSVSFRKMGK
ncbi:hypothetical protein GCM10011408_28800 [Dyella caseinilytica]|nr:hypothetical protein GCM10011408_28800 [Dyella caseinilytica]